MNWLFDCDAWLFELLMKMESSGEFVGKQACVHDLCVQTIYLGTYLGR